jgi:hypothetical protein
MTTAKTLASEFEKTAMRIARIRYRRAGHTVPWEEAPPDVRAQYFAGAADVAHQYVRPFSLNLKDDPFYWLIPVVVVFGVVSLILLWQFSPLYTLL